MRLTGWLGYLGLLSAFVALGTSCGPVVGPQGSSREVESSAPSGRTVGTLAVRVEWPAAGARRTQALPPTVKTIRLTVSAADIKPPIVSTLSAGDAANSTKITVPIGTERTLVVEALNGRGKVIANTTVARIVVSAGEYKPVTASLQILVGAVGGTVTDPAGNPLAGVEISSNGVSTMSDASGSYLLEDLQPGAIPITFVKQGFAVSSPSVTVTAGNTASFPIRLEPQHWFLQGSGTSANLYGVQAISEQEAWAWGAGGTLLRTVDGGATWKLQQSPGTSDILDMAVVQSTKLLASADGVYTAEGDGTWNKVNAITGQGLKVISMATADGQNAVISWTASNGSYTSSTNNGGGSVNLNKQPAPGNTVTPPLTSLAAVTPSHYLAFGTNKVVWTTSAGLAWGTLADIGGTADAGCRHCVYAKDSANLFVAYNALDDTSKPYAAIAASHDYGATWIQEQIGAGNEPLPGIRALAKFGTEVVAVGARHTTLFRRVRSDGSAFWDLVPTQSGIGDVGLNAVSFLDTTTGWAVGDKGVILKY